MNPKEMIDVARALASSRGAYREYRDGWNCPILVAPGLMPGLDAELITVQVSDHIQGTTLTLLGSGWRCRFLICSSGASARFDCIDTPAWADLSDDAATAADMLRRVILDGLLRDRIGARAVA